MKTSITVGSKIILFSFLFYTMLISCTKDKEETSNVPATAAPLLYQYDVTMTGKQNGTNNIQGTSEFVFYNDEGYNQWIKYNHQGVAIDSFVHSIDGVDKFEVVNNKLYQIGDGFNTTPKQNINVFDFSYNVIDKMNFPDLDFRNNYIDFCSDGSMAYFIYIVDKSICKLDLSSLLHPYTFFGKGSLGDQNLCDYSNNFLYLLSITNDEFIFQKWNSNNELVMSRDVSLQFANAFFAFYKKMAVGTKFIYVGIDDEIYIFNSSDLSYVSTRTLPGDLNASAGVLHLDFNDGRLFVLRQSISTGRTYVSVFMEG